MEKKEYSTPAVFELGSFAEETGNIGEKNWDELWYPFDIWV